MASMIDEFLSKVYINPRQKMSIEATMNHYFTDDDYTQLDDVLNFYGEKYSAEELAEAYNLIVADTATETKFFLQNGKYRYSSFEETEKLVYSNHDYMSKYMIGLAISGYLWPNHIKIFHWFQKVMSEHRGDKYLEIGPGHGRYFCEAVKNNGFKEYDAIDVSKTSVEQTKRFINDFLSNELRDKCKVFRQNAYDYNPAYKYDFVVIAEVLEHVEDPKRMLEIIHNISSEESYIYVTVPINAPAIDHIFLFNTIEEVEQMVLEVGYTIVDYLYAPGGDMDLEKAIKRKNSILVGLLARKV